MSSDEQLDSRGLKRAFLKKAISQGRGPEAIAKLNRLAVNKRTTFMAQDEDILGAFEDAANNFRGRKDILDCLNKTNFNREEDPETNQFIMEDLAEQELTIDLLKAEGMPENKLPTLSMALARLNAYERKNGKDSGEIWDEWSDNDPQIQASRQKARSILRQQKIPTHTLN